jgi:hypothetical protein
LEKERARFSRKRASTILWSYQVTVSCYTPAAEQALPIDTARLRRRDRARQAAVTPLV